MQAEDGQSKFMYLLNYWGKKQTSHYMIIRGDGDCLYRINEGILWEKVFIGIYRIVDNVIPKISLNN